MCDARQIRRFACPKPCHDPDTRSVSRVLAGGMATHAGRCKLHQRPFLEQSSVVGQQVG